MPLPKDRSSVASVFSGTKECQVSGCWQCKMFKGIRDRRWPNKGVMKSKRLKVYARSELISTKLPIVKDLIEID